MDGANIPVFCQSDHGVEDRVFACKAAGPGSIPTSWIFFSPFGYKVVGVEPGKIKFA